MGLRQSAEFIRDRLDLPLPLRDSMKGLAAFLAKRADEVEREDAQRTQNASSR